MHKHTSRLLIIIALLYQFLLLGCSATPAGPTGEQTLDHRLEELYLLAKNADPSSSEAYRIEAADLLCQQQRYKEAATIIKGLTLHDLPDSIQALYAIVRAEIALSRVKGQTALDALNQHSEIILQLGQASQLRASKLRARSFDLLERHLDGARERIHIAPLLAPNEVAANEAELWAALIKIPVADLQTALNNTRSSDEQGWLSLVLIAQTNKDNLDKQFTALQHWKLRWPLHPAALHLPEELALLNQIITERPTNIVLMLPFQGRNAAAGKAIRDGFLASYYAARSAGDQMPTLRIIDTSATNDFASLYDQVTLQGADFIIGPLEKQHVESLQARQSLSTPTLALNYGTPDKHTDQLYQFGLSAEDEARQIAQKAWQSGYKTSLMLTPSSSWGQRIASEFNKEWQQLGGTTLGRAQFDTENNYSDTIQKLLDIDTSAQRVKRIRAVLGSNVEFTARPRNDVDFIFVVATPTQARQIKPTLAFHFAGDVPVYATSHIYSGTPAPQLDRDLDKIIFCETPWLLSYQDNPIKKAVDSTWPATAGPLGRLYALGVDAYHLYPRIQLLSTAARNQLAGATGLLTLDESGRVVRSLEWAQIVSGQIRPLP